MVEKVQISKINRAFHCPTSGCLYATGSERYFSNKNLLNQHFAKVHAEKKYICSKCQKGFGLDWWRKYHEISCGKEWKCTCGLKYVSRESLLTHARRSEHTIPAEIRHPPKKNLPKKTSTPAIQPLVVLIQPIIQQQVSYVLPTKSFTDLSNSPRPILPKQPTPTFKILHGIPAASVNKSGTTNLTSNYQSNFVCNATTPITTDSRNLILDNSNANSCGEISLVSSVGTVKAKQRSHQKRAAETQTSLDFPTKKILENVDMFKCRESRASQCSGRLTKQRVRIESTHTQTMESAVVKMKKKTPGNRARRKSVAITTEPEMIEPSMSQPFKSLWPDFEGMVFPSSNNGNDVWSKMDKYSSSTQTSPDINPYSKVLCDSQTFTEDDLLQFTWPKANQQDLLEGNVSTIKILTDLATNHPPPTLSGEYELNSMPMSEILQNTIPSAALNGSTHDRKAERSDLSSIEFSGKNVISEIQSESSLLSSVLDSCLSNSPASLLEPKDINILQNDSVNKNNYPDSCLTNKINSENSVLDSVFIESFSPETTAGQKSDNPLLSHSHTQTSISPMFDYNSLLTNMETQTTEDCLFSDLEFSDTETQTPWDDFLNANDSLSPDQLSIEIQTDFSSFGANDDTYNLIEGINMQNIFQNCSNRGSTGIHMETQTQDRMCLTQFTNSEAQTLEESHYLFE